MGRIKKPRWWGNQLGQVEQEASREVCFKAWATYSAISLASSKELRVVLHDQEAVVVLL
ncbi:MAG: hypothetical protein ACYDHX_02130 [Methanothrix sp.]